MIYDIINEAIQKGASDIHLTRDLYPVLRISGELHLLQKYGLLTPEILETEIKCFITTDSASATYLAHKYLDCSLRIEDNRFRVHIYRQKNSDAVAIRLIPKNIPSIDSLNMPSVIKKFTLLKNGLVLVTGTTGSGKSTTLASMIDDINTHQKKHIITVEDPVEFVHEHKQCIINQREIGQDVPAFADAVRGAMREDPDILLVGEMRDLETIRNTITIAETGHLAFATLHTKSAAETVDRIIDVFPSSQQQQIRIQLANVLQGIISQTLVPKIGGGRVPVCEVLIVNDAIRSLIKEGASPNAITDSIQMNSRKTGTQTIEQSLANLYKNKLITYDTALEHAAHPELLKKNIMHQGD